MFFSAKNFITPLAVSRPNALPPDSTIACTPSLAASGFNSPLSLDAGAPPRISIPVVYPDSLNMTVQPLLESGYSALPNLNSVNAWMDISCNKLFFI